MKTCYRWTARLCVTVCLALMPPLRAQPVTQPLTLHDGWNAVFLEVSPADPAPAVVFADLPLVSVWTRAEPVSSAQFIQDPSEAAFNEAEWLRWAPGEPSFINTLRAIQGRRAYLLKLTNGPVVWQLSGQPIPRQVDWYPDVFNLRSFPVDPAVPPTFRQFFRSSTAHYDRVRDRPHGIYRLSGSGRWEPVQGTDPMAAGEAYWVLCQGESSYTGPLEVRSDAGEALEFGRDLERITLQCVNRTDAPRSVTMQPLGPAIPGILAYQRFDAVEGLEWVDLPTRFTLELSPGASRNLTLAIRRSLMPESDYASLLNISDGLGVRYLFPISAAASSQGKAGLWVGNVRINAVSQPHYGTLTTNLYTLIEGQPTSLTAEGIVASTNESGMVVARTADGRQVPVYEKIERVVDPLTPTPTQSEFVMRLLLHVDAQGTSRLLKEVVQMWREGTYTNNPQGYRVVDKPGAYVLLTQDRLLGQFKGATLRDGVSVGRRLSAIGFDFDGHGTNDMVLAGAFGPGQTLTGEIQLAPNDPLNPFRHKFHPDHDNLDDADPDFKTFKAEAFAVTRQFQFEFAANAGVTASSPDPNYAVMEGTYRETLTGLHKEPLQVRGSFRLSRASYIAELNPSPTP